jgi:hypothetical protein
LLRFEYCHGDNGAGIGASHQTGWTVHAATLIHWFGLVDAKKMLDLGGMPRRE